MKKILNPYVSKSNVEHICQPGKNIIDNIIS